MPTPRSKRETERDKTKTTARKWSGDMHACVLERRRDGATTTQFPLQR